MAEAGLLLAGRELAARLVSLLVLAASDRLVDW